MWLLQSSDFWGAHKLPSGWRYNETLDLWGQRKTDTDNQRCDEKTADECDIMLSLCIIIIMTAEKDMVKRPYEASSIHSSFSRMASMCGLVMTTSSSSNSDGSLWVSIAPIRSTVGLKWEMNSKAWEASSVGCVFELEGCKNYGTVKYCNKNCEVKHNFW